jgi:hypothetical protein
MTVELVVLPGFNDDRKADLTLILTAIKKDIAGRHQVHIGRVSTYMCRFVFMKYYGLYTYF